MQRKIAKKKKKATSQSPQPSVSMIKNSVHDSTFIKRKKKKKAQTSMRQVSHGSDSNAGEWEAGMFNKSPLMFQNRNQKLN